MKKLVLPLLLISGLGNSFAQTSSFTTQFASVRSEMVAWDKVRGEWLANSMEAMSTNQEIPDRNFPEKFAPAEMYMAMPANVRGNVQRLVAAQTTGSDSSSRQQWNTVNQFVSRPVCSAAQGRTYGDPHLTSFDGASFSFQTVGEFNLVKSQSGHMIVQTRQRAEGESVSLNSAVAMWVNGDRVCYYASTFPDGNRSTPFRVDGQAVYIENGTYYLNHGGVITATKNDYIVTWPTGERVKLDRGTFGSGDFVNVAVEIFPCADTYDGVLGNANGRQNDDFDVNGRQPNMNMGVFASSDASSDALQRQYQAFLAQDFASYWRVTPQTSLFDYGFGQSTASFTDASFPRVYQTIGDLNQSDRDRARRDCERQGFTGASLNACIYDNGFLRIPPTPQPSVPVVVREPITTPITNPAPNVNPGGRTIGRVTPTPNPPVRGGGSEPTGTSDVGSETISRDSGAGTSGIIAQPRETSTTTPIETSSGSEPITRGDGTATSTTTKQPNPYEPPIEPERKVIRVMKQTVSSPSTSGSGNSGNSSSGSSSSTPSRSTSSPEPSPAPRPTPAPAPRPAPAPKASPAPAPTPAPAPRTAPAPAKRP